MTEWTGYSLAAQSMALQTLEQVRSAKWDPSNNQCEVTNMPLMSSNLVYSSGAVWSSYSGYVTNILDVPWKSTNCVTVTNFIVFQVLSLSANTNIQLIQARVDTVWPFNGWGSFQARLYTNTICTYLAPDNPDAATLGK